MDYAAYREDSSSLADRTLIRRASLGIKGKFGDWRFEVDYDFAGDGEFEDVRIGYEGWAAGNASMGQYKVPFGLEELTSYSTTTFIERSLATEAFVPSRRLGLGFDRKGRRYTASAMAFGPEIDGDDRRGVGVRTTFAPLRANGRLIHLGVAATIERAGNSVELRAPPEARPGGYYLVRTGDLDDVDRIALLGLETAWQRGPVSLQAEWMRTALRRTTGRPDLNFDGWYLVGSWFITGETRSYRDGTFKGVRTDRRGGAWELVARYSHVSLDDRDIAGGSERNVTFGVNWYVNDHLRLMLNYIDVHSQRHRVADNPKIFLMRAQLTFY
ncbi:MAG: porin [Burkholderiaceae bacterium]